MTSAAGMGVRCGTDIVEVARIRRILETSCGTRFLRRVFTDAESAYCEKRNAARFESYAARFAVKEAFAKAVGTGLFAGVKLLEIEVVNNQDTGAPALSLSGGAELVFRRLGGISIAVSLSHTKEYATATVVILYVGTM